MRAQIALVGLGSFLFFQVPVAGAQYAPNTVIIRFLPGVITEAPLTPSGAIEDWTSPGAVQEALIAVGAVEMERLLPDFDGVDAIAVNGQPVTLPYDMSHVYVVTLAEPNVSEAIGILSAVTPDVVYAEPDYVLHADLDPDDEMFDQQWWLKNTGQIPGTPPNEDIRATAAWNTTTGYVPIQLYDRTVVAILDTGIDFDHDSYSNPQGDLRVSRGHDFVYGGVSDDENGHGTAVAGIVGAIGDNGSYGVGVDWETEVMSVKVLDNSGYALTSSVCKGIEFVRSLRVPIVNMSFGTDQSTNIYHEIVKNAHAAGVLLVASMGNANSGALNFPAAFNGMVLAVGAVYADGERWEDAKINETYGCTYPGGGSNFAQWIDISAPGGRSIATTRLMEDGGFFEVSDPCDPAFGGTSAAAPVVSGVASLVRSIFGNVGNPLTGEDLEQILIRTARDVESEGEGFDIYTGWGIVNAEAAVEFVSNGRMLEQGVAEGVGTTRARNRVMTFYSVAGLQDGHEYHVREWEFQNQILFEIPFVEPPDVWGKSFESLGWSNTNPHNEMALPFHFSEIVPGSVSSSGMFIRTYFYEVFEDQEHAEFVGWYPEDPTVNYPNLIQMAWTALGIPAATSVPRDKVSQHQLLVAKAYPNPGSRAISISFSSPDETHVSLEIYDVAGRLVRNLMNQLLPAGNHEVMWGTTRANGELAPPGIYFYRLEAAGNVISGKMSVLR